MVGNRCWEGRKGKKVWRQENQTNLLYVFFRRGRRKKFLALRSFCFTKTFKRVSIYFQSFLDGQTAKEQIETHIRISLYYIITKKKKESEKKQSCAFLFYIILFRILLFLLLLFLSVFLLLPYFVISFYIYIKKTF